MSFMCQSCRRRRTGRSYTTLLGRTVCQECYIGLSSASVSVIAGGGVTEVISTQVWYKRIRQQRRLRRQ